MKRGFVATDVFKVMYGLNHNYMCTGCVTHLITQTVTVFFFKLNSVVPLEFVFQVISLQRSAPLRVGEVIASPVSMANTRIQLTSLPTAENAKAAKVQYSGLYPNKSGSPV